ncbi:short-chain dehydrogenase/reductase-like protein [Xylogone sp. PMI_703]|nr:short-chain dehydrogenase/reductase-like protein [Xylogone sp. PMI_703]
MFSYPIAQDTSRGPGDARPTAQQIIQDQGLEHNLIDKTILITGCSSGLGVETARALASTGATLYLTVRHEAIEKAKAALSDILELSRVHLLTLDLFSLESVRNCAADFLSKSTPLNILIENAGVMATPEGPSSTPEFNSRVVILSSSNHGASEVNFENINLDGEYEPWKAYGQSKTANIWTANQIEHKYGTRGLHAFSLHPGIIMTELSRHVTSEQMSSWSKDKTILKLMKSAEQGAATTVWAAVTKELEGMGGKYLEECQIAKPYDVSSGQWGTGYAPWVYDRQKEARLWTVSLSLLGMAKDS